MGRLPSAAPARSRPLSPQPSRRRVEPRAAYRLQLREEFDLDAAAAVVPYLAELGVSHVYLSPVLAAAPGSQHGYDVADPTEVSPALGGEAAFDRLLTATAAAGLGVLLDVVPNHMAADPDANPWWRDVLADGRQSPFADWFDIDWEPDDEELRSRVLVPILDGTLEGALAEGRLRLRRRGGEVVVDTGAQTLPVRVATLSGLLSEAAATGGGEGINALAVEAGGLALDEAGTLALDRVRDLAGDVADALALEEASDAAARERRAEQRRALAAGLEGCCAAEAAAAAALDGVLGALSADVERMRVLLGAQWWLLSDWREQDRRLNYRRFFTIASLVGVRIEEPAAFDAVHALPLRWVLRGGGEGLGIDGLRIDHVDGLRDPARYLERLAERSGGAWTVVEKILESGEALPAGWAADGTTGYELGSLLVASSLDPVGVERLRRLGDRLAGGATGCFDEDVAAAKREVLEHGLAPDLARLLRGLRRFAADDPALAGADADELRGATVALLCAMPVYRTYADPRDGTTSHADRGVVARAAAGARGSVGASDAVDPGIIERLGALLCGEGWDAAGRAAGFVARFQQLAPAVMAKGLEDTVLYRDTSVLAAWEVGCSPERPLLDASATLAALGAGVEHPRGLLATSTHDTKRSEDVRARLCVLSQLAGEWEALVETWRERHARHRRGELPDAATELMLYQTLACAWPIDAERTTAYALKAVREASLHTNWTAPDEAYEEALRGFIGGVLDGDAFITDLERLLATRLARPGAVVSLAWTLLRLTAPGVPDTYQGCEVWDRSLVDPDNRRPVDYELRRGLLERARTASAAELRADLDADGPGLVKLAVVTRALDLRRRRPELFGSDGGFTPLPATGGRADHCVVFARGATPGAVTVVPRLPVAVAAGFGDTSLELPAGEWRDLLGGGVHRGGGGGAVAIDAVLAELPVALLERVG